MKNVLVKLPVFVDYLPPQHGRAWAGHGSGCQPWGSCSATGSCFEERVKPPASTTAISDPQKWHFGNDLEKSFFQRYDSLSLLASCRHPSFSPPSTPPALHTHSILSSKTDEGSGWKAWYNPQWRQWKTFSKHCAPLILQRKKDDFTWNLEEWCKSRVCLQDASWLKTEVYYPAW